MKLECLRAVASYYKRKCPLALCAASPRARVAVELNQNYECGVFTISIDKARTTRSVGLCLYSLDERRVDVDDETMMDWWLLRRETCLPISFEACRPDIDFWTPEGGESCIEESAMLPIVQTMSIHSNPSSLCWIGACTKLEILEAPGCLYPIDFSGFQYLSCLKILDVHNSKTESFEGISGCVNLEDLNVSGCTGTGDYSPIGRCSRLKELNMDGCNTITDCSWIGQLKLLTDLYINDVELGDMGWIAGCTSLESLLMVGSFYENYHPIMSLKALRHLSWCGDDVTDIQWTKNMDSLHTVYVRSDDSRIYVNRDDYPDAKTWCDVLQACGAFKRSTRNEANRYVA